MKIHVPESLKRNSDVRGGGGGEEYGEQKTKKMKLSHKDISSIMTLQKNQALLQRYRREKERSRREEAYHKKTIEMGEDFITAFLIKWSLRNLIKVTTLLLDVMNHVVDENHYEESHFSNHTIIHVTESETHSFADYYRMVYQSAVEKTKGGGAGDDDVVMDEEEEYRQTHIMKLLRACFVIGFLYDARIRRFVMAHHSIHTRYMLTRPPHVEKIKRFMCEATPVVDAFLFESRVNILEMIDQCVGMWLGRYMV